VLEDVDLKASLKGRSNRLGIYAAAVYLFIVAVVYILTAYTGTTDDSGLQWIPFFMLGLPWSRISAQFLFPGLIINAGILFLIGTLVEKYWKFWRSLVQKSQF
jgi:hypothetical protein